MKIPDPVRLPSGSWRIQLRIDGRSISVTEKSRRECSRRASLIKAEYLAGKRQIEAPRPALTLSEAIDRFIVKRSNTLSPSTIMGYRIIHRNRFQSLASRSVFDISASDWILAVNAEALTCSPKTLTNSWRFIKTVLREEAGIQAPAVTLPQIPPNERPFLTADQIPLFLSAISGADVELPALLALSSLRRSEIFALKWANVDLNSRLVHVCAATVPDEHSRLVLKAQTKNRSSSRYVPVMMDRLYELLSEGKRKAPPGAPVVPLYPETVRKRIDRICLANDLPRVGLHGLRHSFASLAKHVDMPEKVTMEIGGWSDPQTMRKIYTHISQQDADRYKNAMAAFYNASPTPVLVHGADSAENAHENAHEN